MTQMRDLGVVAFFGPDGTCLTEAKLAAAWNLPLISHKCAGARGSREAGGLGATFARTLPPAHKVSKSVVALLKAFGWNEFTIVAGDERTAAGQQMDAIKLIKKCAGARGSREAGGLGATFARTLPPAHKVSKSVVALLKAFGWNEFTIVAGDERTAAGQQMDAIKKCAGARGSREAGGLGATFARTLPPAHKVSKSVVALLKAFGWNEFTIVAGDERTAAGQQMDAIKKCAGAHGSREAGGLGATFARTLPPAHKVSKSVVALLKAFGWNKFAIVAGDERTAAGQQMDVIK